MKKFLLIVNTTILLFLFTFTVIPVIEKILAQSNTPSPAQGGEYPFCSLSEILKIFFQHNLNVTPTPRGGKTPTLPPGGKTPTPPPDGITPTPGGLTPTTEPPPAPPSGLVYYP